ncbi:hypothetical protein TSUD_303070 [Trifolium subterraneum]|uniref:AB hydrolase-1 domain-containing protein n=1 Tax=Trifolium subterraneum TaxID=3900 RepID=A0A2Z6NFV7_TRISU|nr:hypothetical protein TSUD_303070 [Trifolium subterraneum]
MVVREIEEGVDSNSREINTIPLKQHFVLVHGISGGSWCWYKIRCLMENSGYKVSCIDLKSGGIDQSDADSILTFDDYNKPLMDFISSLPDNEKVSLAVYVAATMLKFGYSTAEDLKDGVPDLSEFGDDVYELGFGLGHDKPPTSALIKKELQRKILYSLSPHEDSTLASMLLRPGPLLALTSAKFKVENIEVEKVPRVYIRTSHDNVVKPKQQEAMINRWPPSSVYELDSDHSPFFSAPFLLFGLLVKAAIFYVGCN